MKDICLKNLHLLLYTLIGFVCISAPISAHHSAEMFNSDETITLIGTVKEFRYINPHSWLIVDIENDDGTITTWGFEGEGPQDMMHGGVRKNDLPPGEKITITGTNGKSTTAKLLFNILKDQNKEVILAGNIGIPILSKSKIKPDTIFVIEASSYQIDYSQYFKTDYAFILNISPDHLERHKTIQNYAHAKFKLILKQKKNFYAFIENNKYLNREIKKYKVKSKIIKVNENNEKIKKLISNSYFDNINNLKNLSFILEFVKKYKLNRSKLLKTVNLFKGLNFRQQIIYKSKFVTIINDSKSTSFSSSINLLKSYKNIFWIVGGLAKKGDKFILPKKYYKNINGYIFGKDKKIFIKAFNKKLKFQVFSRLQQITKKIKIDLNNKDHTNILFSPAAASFDQFSNFEDRGKYFNNLIKKNNFLGN